MNKFQCNSTRNAIIFIQKNACEIVVCQNGGPFVQGRWINKKCILYIHSAQFAGQTHAWFSSLERCTDLFVVFFSVWLNCYIFWFHYSIMHVWIAIWVSLLMTLVLRIASSFLYGIPKKNWPVHFILTRGMLFDLENISVMNAPPPPPHPPTPPPTPRARLKATRIYFLQFIMIWPYFFVNISHVDKHRKNRKTVIKYNDNEVFHFDMYSIWLSYDYSPGMANCHPINIEWTMICRVMWDATYSQ